MKMLKFCGVIRNIALTALTIVFLTACGTSSNSSVDGRVKELCERFEAFNAKLQSLPLDSPELKEFDVEMVNDFVNDTTTLSADDKAALKAQFAALTETTIQKIKEQNPELTEKDLEGGRQAALDKQAKWIDESSTIGEFIGLFNQ